MLAGHRVRNVVDGCSKLVAGKEGERKQKVESTQKLYGCVVVLMDLDLNCIANRMFWSSPNSA